MSLHVRTGLRFCCRTSDILLPKVHQNGGSLGIITSCCKCRLPASAPFVSSWTVQIPLFWLSPHLTWPPLSARRMAIHLSCGLMSSPTGVAGRRHHCGYSPNFSLLWLFPTWNTHCLTKLPHCSILDFSASP